MSNSLILSLSLSSLKLLSYHTFFLSRSFFLYLSISLSPRHSLCLCCLVYQKPASFSILWAAVSKGRQNKFAVKTRRDDVGIKVRTSFLGSGGDQLVSVLAFYSDDPSSYPAEVNSFYSVNCLKRTKINKKRPGMALFLKQKKERDFHQIVI